MGCRREAGGNRASRSSLLTLFCSSAHLDGVNGWAHNGVMSESRTIISFDWAIKTVLRDKANFDILEGFLSALLRDQIKVVELLDTEGTPGGENLKTNRVDIMVRNNRNELMIVEVQYQTEAGYFSRVLYGASKVIVDHMAAGMPYTDVKKVISVSIVYFDIGLGDDYVYHGRTEFTGLHSSHVFKVKEDTVGYLTGLPPHDLDPWEIFPEYYIITLKQFDESIRDELDQWVYAFKHSQVRDDFDAPSMPALRDKLDVLRMSSSERKAYDRYIYNRTSEEGVMVDARRKGRAEGLVTGRAEGLAEGLVEGRMEGKAERDAELRQKLVAQGMAPAAIDALLG
jgi:hypothetical protein